MIKYPLKNKAEDKGSLKFINEYAQRSEFMKRIKDSYFLAMLKSPPQKPDGSHGVFKKGDGGTDFKSYYLGETDINDIYHQSGATYMLLRIVNGEDRASETLTVRGRKRAGDSFLKKYEEQSIVANVDWLLCRYEKDNDKRYPGVPAAEYADLKNAEKNEYVRHTETVTAVQCLKLFLQAYLAHKSGKIIFNDAKENYYTPHFEKRIEKAIDHCLQCVNRNFFSPEEVQTAQAGMGDDFWCGWNYGRKVTKHPSLYFTFFVLEAFMEFEDTVDNVFYVVEGGGEKALSGEFSGVAFYNEYLKFETAARTAGYTLWMEYKDCLSKGFFTEGSKQNITISDVLDKGAVNAPYNALFVVLAVIYSSVNRILDKNGGIDADLRDGLIELKKKKGTDTLENYSNVIQSIMPTFDSLIKEAKDKGKLYKLQDYIVEIEKEWLRANERNNAAVNREIDEFNMFDRLLGATLIPLLTRANNLYAFYIAKYPKKDISGYFDMLTDSRLEIKDVGYHFEQARSIKALDVQPVSGKTYFDDATYNEKVWLWGASGNFDVHASDKAINAVIDFYEYYDEFENPYIDPETKNKKLEEKFNKELSELRAENAKKLAERELRFKDEKNELSASFHIENAIVSKIERVFESKKGELERMIYDAVKRIFADALNDKYELEAESRFGGEDADELVKLYVASMFSDYRPEGDDAADIKHKLGERIDGFKLFDEIKNKYLKNKKEE